MRHGILEYKYFCLNCNGVRTGILHFEILLFVLEFVLQVVDCIMFTESIGHDGGNDDDDDLNWE